MGCQTSVAEAVIDTRAATDAGADYVIRFKDNQEGLRADVKRLFERRFDLGFGSGYTDVGAGHGRGETRRCWAVDIAGKGRVDESRWPGLQSVALVETEPLRRRAARGNARGRSRRRGDRDRTPVPHL